MELLKTLVVTAGALALFASCGRTEHKRRLVTGAEDAATTRAPKATKDEGIALSNAADSFCPAGWTLDSTYWICTSGGRALGPFPPAMVDACIAAKGGESACRGSNWNADFARSIRGKGICPRGTTLDAAIDECAVGSDVYGPFSRAFVAFCKKNSAQSSACESMRVHRSFAESFKKGTTQSGLSVPYFYQYDNANEPGRTCNLTSVAMVARYYGKSVTPDQLYNIAGGPVFTGPDMVWAARQVGLDGSFSSTASVATIKSHLDAGRPVILQGWFTGAGHIIVITGYDASGWIVNDPSGDWERCYMCGYPNRTPTNGRGVRYTYAQMAVAATDPGNPSSYWITVLTR